MRKLEFAPRLGFERYPNPQFGLGAPPRVRGNGLAKAENLPLKMRKLPDARGKTLAKRVKMRRAGLCSLVLANLRLDFRGMRARISPSVHQIFGMQGRIGASRDCSLVPRRRSSSPWRP